MTDRQGAKVMLPQYFGVLPANRGRGHGRSLWRYAAAWGESHQAAYQLLQTAAGGPSDRLFCSEGLATLGFATAVPT
jgi:GNAT superfamily N-acetyltransferase